MFVGRWPSSSLTVPEVCTRNSVQPRMDRACKGWRPRLLESLSKSFVKLQNADDAFAHLQDAPVRWSVRPSVSLSFLVSLSVCLFACLVVCLSVPHVLAFASLFLSVSINVCLTL